MDLHGKPVDLDLFQQELAAASITVPGLGMFQDQIFTFDASGAQIDLPPEAAPVLEAHDASKRTRTAEFESQEDLARLQLVTERAAEDPAFAALADLTLPKG